MFKQVTSEVNRVERKRGRPTGHKRVPLSLEERRARNAQYERERRKETAEAKAVLAEAVGCEPNKSNEIIMQLAIEQIQLLKKCLRENKEVIATEKEKVRRNKKYLEQLKYEKKTENEKKDNHVVSPDLPFDLAPEPQDALGLAEGWAVPNDPFGWTLPDPMTGEPIRVAGLSAWRMESPMMEFPPFESASESTRSPVDLDSLTDDEKIYIWGLLEPMDATSDSSS